MKKQNFEINEKFLNFMYHAFIEKLNAETEDSEYLDEAGLADKRAPIALGDFFEQILGLNRNDVLSQSYERLGQFFRPNSNPSDPAIANILFHAELSRICGHEELDFDDIYPQQISN
jgi:hypothetical protein